LEARNPRDGRQDSGEHVGASSVPLFSPPVSCFAGCGSSAASLQSTTPAAAAASAARTANLPLLRGVHAICGQAYEFSAPTAIALRGADLFVADEERNDVTKLNTSTGSLVRSR
jgi:hypothetical protein